MHMFMIWRVLCFVGASLCVNELEYGGNYADNYDNEISQDQQEGERLLFIASLSLLFPACLHRRLFGKNSSCLISKSQSDTSYLL